MKKSTLLSLLTAGAVIATSAGTFAAWDQTTATAKSEELTFRKGVTTSIAKLNFTSTNENTLNETPVYKADTNITVSDLPSGVSPSDYQVKVTAYAYDTDAHAEEAKNSADPAAYTTGRLADVTVNVKNEITPLTTATETINPEITVTPSESKNSSVSKASIVVVAELEEKTN